MGFSKLEKKIKEQAQKYYTDGSNDLTDAQFDELVDELRKENPNSEVLKTGWGYSVEEDSTPGEKVKHKYGLVGSLSKIHTYAEIPKECRQILGTTMCQFSLKLDGLSVVLYYRQGVLADAVTRGDGTTGISIVNKIPYIDSSLLHLHRDKYFTGAVRGEILMSHKNFEEFRANNPDAKNPRNAAAGLVNRKEGFEDLKYLDIIVYTIVGYEPTNKAGQLTLMQQVQSWLGQNFSKINKSQFVTIPESEHSDKTFDSQMDFYKDWWYGTYPADGIVLNFGIKHNIFTGEISYNSLAFKYPNEYKTTKVIDVEWEMSKTRYAIPRVHVEPVELCGTMVEYAAGHNAKNIEESKIGPGAIVRICKANEIIPMIGEILEPCKDTKSIDVCPDCGEPLVWSGVHKMCINESCGNASQQDLLTWINTLAPVDGFGDLLRLKFLKENLGDDLTIENLMSKGQELTSWARSQASIPTTNKQTQLYCSMLLKLFEGKIAANQAIAALNIPRFGDITCDKLAKYPDVMERIFDAALKEDDASLLDIYGYIGDANADSVINNLKKFKRWKYIWSRIDFSSTEVEFKGKVVITGKLSVKRSDFEKELKAAGWEPTSAVSKDTKFLITDDPTSSSSKNIKANQLGISKITEQEFRNQYM